MTDKNYGQPMKDLENWLKPELANLLLDVARDHNPRNWLILYLLLRTGRRIGELLMLKPKDISWEQGMILWNIEKKTEPLKDSEGNIIGRKKKEYRKWKTLDSEAMKHLGNYIVSEGIMPEEYVFYSPYKGKTHHLSRVAVWTFLNKYSKELSIPVHPHTFRHTFSVWISQNMNNPSDLIKLKDMLEHSDIKITENYLQFSPKSSRDLLERTFNLKDSQKG